MNIFQRLRHFLFGCHYVETAHGTHRVRTAPNGQKYVLFCGFFSFGGYVWFMNDDGTFANTTGPWWPLTFEWPPKDTEPKLKVAS